MARAEELHLTRPKLRHSIGGLGFFSLAFGSMIGVGWITALGSWFLHAGPGGAVVAFLAGGTLMLVIGLCYAEVTPMMPVSGGEVAYAYKAYGTGRAFLIGWFLAFGYLSVSAFEAISVGTVLAYLVPGLDAWPLYAVGGTTVYGSHLLLAAAFTAAITAINYVGVEVATRVQVALTLTLLACSVMFVGAGVATGSTANLAPLWGPGSAAADAVSGAAVPGTGGSGLALGGILAVLVTVPFWYVGFDTIPQAAEERREGSSLRALGRWVILAIVGSTLFYVAVILGAGMAAPWPSIAEAELATAAAFRAAFAERWMADLVLVAGVIGLLTSWNGFFLAGSRVLFALGRGHVIPPAFGATHPRHDTPARAVLLAGGVTFVAACLGRGAMLAFVDVGSFCIALAFLGVSLTVGTLRRRFPEMERPYRVPGGAWLPRLAAAGSVFILGVMLVPGSPGRLTWPLEWGILAALSVAGGVFWLAGRRYREAIDEADRAELILEDYARGEAVGGGPEERSSTDRRG